MPINLILGLALGSAVSVGPSGLIFSSGSNSQYLLVIF